jgi:hypothetical protein
MPSVWIEKWDVQGTSGKTYHVSRKQDGTFGCDCPAWIFQKKVNGERKDCQHILQQKFLLMQKGPAFEAKKESKFDDITEQKRSVCLGE